MPLPLPAATEAHLDRLATGLTGAVVICGFPASGKSTAADSLHTRTGAPVLSVIRAAHAAGRSLAEHFRAVSGTPDSAPVRTLWLDTPPERIRERMIARGAGRDAPKLADWTAYRDGVLVAGNREKAHAVCDLVLDT